MSINDLDLQTALPTVLWEHQGEVEVIDYHVQTLDLSDPSHDAADILDLDHELALLEEALVRYDLSADAVAYVEVQS